MKSFLHMMLIVVVVFLSSRAIVNYFVKNNPNNRSQNITKDLSADTVPVAKAVDAATSDVMTNNVSNQIATDEPSANTEIKLAEPVNINNAKIEEKIDNEVEISSSDLTQHNDSFMIQDSDIVLGNKNSKIVVIEYFAFTCPHCAYYHEKIFPEIQKKYIDTNKIAYIIREFIGNKQDFEASLLARCHKDQAKFLQFQDILLHQQNNWAFSKNFREVLTNIGQLGGVSVEEYNTCLNDASLSQILLENSKLTTKITGFQGTPAFIINGKLTILPEVVNAIGQAIGN